MGIKSGLAYGRVWHLFDARGQIMGNLAKKIAITLRGKYKPTHNKSVDIGDYVVVINARHVKLTGNKRENKTYFSHSTYPGHAKFTTFQQMMDKSPTKPLEKAVYGMLPHYNSRDSQMARLKIFADHDHPYDLNIARGYIPETQMQRNDPF